MPQGILGTFLSNFCVWTHTFEVVCHLTSLLIALESWFSGNWPLWRTNKPIFCEGENDREDYVVRLTNNSGRKSGQGLTACPLWIITALFSNILVILVTLDHLSTLRMNINNVSKPNPINTTMCLNRVSNLYLYLHSLWAQYTHSISLPSHGDGKGDVQLPFRKRPCDDDRDRAVGLCNATLGSINLQKELLYLLKLMSKGLLHLSLFWIPRKTVCFMIYCVPFPHLAPHVLPSSKIQNGFREDTSTPGEMGSISKISTGKSHLASKMFILKLPRVSQFICVQVCDSILAPLRFSLLFRGTLGICFGVYALIGRDSWKHCTGKHDKYYHQTTCSCTLAHITATSRLRETAFL